MNNFNISNSSEDFSRSPEAEAKRAAKRGEVRVKPVIKPTTPIKITAKPVFSGFQGMKPYTGSSPRILSPSSIPRPIASPKPYPRSSPKPVAQKFDPRKFQAPPEYDPKTAAQVHFEFPSDSKSIPESVAERISSPGKKKMSKNMKIGLGIGAGVAATGTGIYIYKKYKDKKKKELQALQAQKDLEAPTQGYTPYPNSQTRATYEVPTGDYSEENLNE